MLALTLAFAASLYLVGLRADRIHAGRAVTGVKSVGAVLAVHSARRGFVVRKQREEQPVRYPGLYRGHSARYWAYRYRARTRELQQARAHLHATWKPTVSYALRLASAVFGVPYGELAAVSYCESTWNPYARNGGQLGLFQLGWRPFGLDPYDPVANALSAAATVVHDHGWRQWVCRP